MAAALYLLTKAEAEKPHKPLIDGIQAIIMLLDNGHTDAQLIAHAVAKAQHLGHDVPSGYFDTVIALATILDTDEDAILALARGYETHIAP